MIKTSADKRKEQQGLTITIVCVVIISAMFIFQNIEKQKKIEKGGAYAVSVALGHKVQHKVIKLSQSNVQFLINGEYGKVFKSGKTMVVYPYPDANSPFSKLFSQEFDKVLKDPKYTSYYAFVLFPENPNNQFFQLCHSICFVNPKKEEMLYITRTGDDAGKMLPMILDGLMKW